MNLTFLNMTTLVSIAGTVTALGSAYLTLRKIARDNERHKREQSASIMQLAKEADQTIRLKLENQIHDLEVKLEVFKEVIDKDLEHVKESFNNEIKFLGQKIESLREEVRDQHSQLVGLLSKMIDKD